MTNLTLERVAELAGVSRSTVSRVVNGHSGVRDDVRRRVQQLIRETGYLPHAGARSLAGHRSHIVGVIIPQRVQWLFSDPYFPRLIQGLTHASNKHDYTLSLFLFHTEADENKLYPRVVSANLLDGVIVASLVMGDPLAPKLLARKVPFVAVGRPEIDNVSYVDVDNLGGGYMATSHLLRLGHRPVATITGPLNTTSGLDRRTGYLNALNAYGVSPNECLIVEGDFTEAGGYLAMQRLMPQRPAAVFVASDTMALGALRALREAGLVVPADMALVGFDDLSPAIGAVPPLTTVHQPIRRTGAMAFDTLVDILEQGIEPVRRIVLPTELVIRESCGAALGRF
jgi:LacI family transcriptional regulator